MTLARHQAPSEKAAINIQEAGLTISLAKNEVKDNFIYFSLCALSAGLRSNDEILSLFLPRRNQTGGGGV